MTIKELKVNGKDISELNSAETTDLVRALLAHRKQLNDAARKSREAVKNERKAKAAKRTADRKAKLLAQLAALEAAA